jgi:hypothetical protein
VHGSLIPSGLDGPQSGTFDGVSHVISSLPGAWDGFSVGLESQVQQGLNLVLPLKNPAQMGDLAAVLVQAKQQAHEAVIGLRNIHSARFVPSPDYASLWVITMFDGDLDSYLMDFVGTLGEVFDAILVYIKGAPPLPVRDFPDEYVEFVKTHNISVGTLCAYPDSTVLDILQGSRR